MYLADLFIKVRGFELVASHKNQLGYILPTVFKIRVKVRVSPSLINVIIVVMLFYCYYLPSINKYFWNHQIIFYSFIYVQRQKSNVCTRCFRGGMVQTAEQYEFIHRALALFERSLPDQSGEWRLTSVLRTAGITQPGAA